MFYTLRLVFSSKLNNGSKGERTVTVGYVMQGEYTKGNCKDTQQTESTIYDVRALRDKLEQSLNDLAKNTLPFIFEQCMDGIREIIKECWAIILKIRR